MSEEWTEVSLSALFALDNAKLGEHAQEPRVLSLSKYDGFVPSDEYFEKRIASAKLDAYKTIDQDGWAYSTIHIDEGSIARNTLGFAGVISPMYTTMRWIGEQHDPGFFELLLRSPQMLAEYSDNAQGSINRRRSLPFKTFALLTVAVPPLAVQRRIVDLLAHLDNHLTNLRAERDAALRFLHAVRQSELEALDERLPLGDVLLTLRAGGTPSREHPEFFGGGIPWLKSGEVDNPSISETSEFISDTGLAKSSAWLVPCGAVVLAMYGQGDTKGTAGYLEVPMATNQAVLAMVPDPDACNGRFLLHWVRWHTDALRLAATGAAQPNLSKALVEREVTFPSIAVDQQARIAGILDSFLAVDGQLESEIAGLADLRANLLNVLLTNSDQILPAYDSLLAGVA